ncbi:15861_t:CDS:1, partial [Dentiscutata erythropus]
PVEIIKIIVPTLPLITSVGGLLFTFDNSGLSLFAWSSRL